MKNLRFYEITTDLPLWQSIDCKAEEYLGSHKTAEGWIFRVWAPHAVSVSVTGDFCGWDTHAYIMKKVSKNGVWELEISGLDTFDSYKYAIETYDGRVVYKSDVYAYHFETRPGTASKLFDINGFKWSDTSWMKKRSKCDKFNSPMNIYEVHAGSWRHDDLGRELSYSALADKLIDYVLEMGYTHIELMPLTEYPYDKSWGYQVTGYFAPTSRYGTPFDFMNFINRCHRRGVGVIMDWVPAHFPKDEMGLYEYDGKCLYEYEDELKREHPDWGTRIFDYSKREVASFLISSACYWLDKYHIDGLRVDAVASMLYLDYGKQDGQWRQNEYGGNGNLEAVEFLKLFNTVVHKDRPGVFTIAEESTAWPLVTAPVDNGGLGFDFKWNMGWMNDTLKYMSAPHEYRHDKQNMMSFSTSYAFSENFILPLSHDEVVHGKCSLIEKMPGFYDDKFANLRAYMGYMYTHPGKKMIFMGDEFAHFREWDESTELDWMLLDFPAHSAFMEYIRALNHLYKKDKCLYECDSGYNGFCWISADDSRNSVYAYRRIDASGNEIIAVFNFSAYHLEDYSLGMPYPGRYRMILSSDSSQYGGFDRHLSYFTADPLPLHGLEYSARLNLAPFSAVMYKKSAQRQKKQK